MTHDTNINNGPPHEKPNFSNIIKMKGGRGGSSFLITGRDKSALIDCGMANAALETTRALEERLLELDGDRRLDYILLSHSHYDHIGGVPFLKRHWPDLKVMGASYCQQVLKRPGALKVIRNLATTASVFFESEEAAQGLDYRDDELKVDETIAEGDVFDLGGTTIQVLETPGHTNCSLSFFLPEESVIFPSESIGTIEVYGESIMTGIMTSFEDSLESLIKCRKVGARHIVSPHFGFIHDDYVDRYWDWALSGIFDAALLFYEGYRKGWDEDRILQAYTEEYCTGFTRTEQPDEAYQINTRSAIRACIRELGQE